MPEDGRNIYKTCRELAGYTQEHAAELLGCSVRALARYEGGEAFPSDDLAIRMDALYTNHFLAYDHLCQTSQVAAALLPPVEACDYQTASLRFFNLLEEMEAVGRWLLRSAEDNRLDEQEQAEFETRILPVLKRVGGSATEVRLAAGRST